MNHLEFAARALNADVQGKKKKLDRLALIKKLHNSHNLTAVVNASYSEVKEEIDLVTLHEDKGNLELDENTIDIPSKELMNQIDFSKGIKDPESNYLLSAKEKNFLKAETLRNRIQLAVVG